MQPSQKECSSGPSVCLHITLKVIYILINLHASVHNSDTVLFKTLGAVRYVFKKINVFLQKECIKWFKSDSKDIDITKGFYFN